VHGRISNLDQSSLQLIDLGCDRIEEPLTKPRVLPLVEQTAVRRERLRAQEASP
jgi:hypothetical protein